MSKKSGTYLDISVLLENRRLVELENLVLGEIEFFEIWIVFEKMWVELLDEVVPGIEK